MVKKILVVSDSHGKSQYVKEAIDKEYPDMLIHLGDIEDDPETVRGWLDEAARVWNALHSENKDELKSLPIPAVFIKGNCDRYYTGDSGAGTSLKSAAVFDLNGHRFYCTHGHKQGVGYGLENLMYTALENDCDIALYGHTHVPFNDTFEGFGDAGESVRIINPGSISLPRGGSKKSYVVMTFDDEGNYDIEHKIIR